MVKKQMTDAEQAAAKLIKEKSDKIKADEKKSREQQKKAAKELDKIKSDAKKEAAKVKAKEKAETEKAKTIKSLVPIAKEINTRIDKAAKMFKDADDHRLAAAIKMDDARGVCRDMKIPFQDWVKDNVKQSYETVRKLLPIGAAENEEEGAGKLLLTDMREGNKQANKKHRDKKKAAPGSASGDETVAKKPKPPANRAIEALKELPDEQAAELVKDQARRLKINVEGNKEAETLSPMNKAKLVYNQLSADEKTAFRQWAADKAKEADKPVSEIPAALDKRKKKTKK